MRLLQGKQLHKYTQRSKNRDRGRAYTPEYTTDSQRFRIHPGTNLSEYNNLCCPQKSWGYWDFFRLSRAANSAVGGPIKPKFKLVRALMHVIIACKYEKDQMKNTEPRKSEDTIFPIITLSNIETNGWIWPNFKHIQALMYVIITCKYEKDPIEKTAQKKWRHHFSHYKPMDIFIDGQGQLTPQWVVQSG